MSYRYPGDFCLGCNRGVYFVRGEMKGCKCIVNPTEAVENCEKCESLWLPCEYHRGYEDGWIAALRDAQARSAKSATPGTNG